MKLLSTCYYGEFPAWTWPDWCMEEIRSRFPWIKVVHVNSMEQAAIEIQDADILFAWRITEEQFVAARQLKWIHTGMAGLTWLLIPPVVESPVRVSNSRGVHAIPIAEHVMALMLSLSRRLPDCLDAQRNSRWSRRDIWERVPSFEELHGKTVGILGIGTLGAEIGRKAKAFEMRVIGIRRNVSERPDCADEIVSPAAMDAILPRLDYLVVAAPLTADTHHIISRAQFERMKTTAYLINVARGELVDQDALIAALNSGRIAGAGLDVFTPDPLPDGHPLFSVRNVIITPHNSGVSPMLWRRVMDIFLENIQRFLDGRELINEVRDKNRGY